MHVGGVRPCRGAGYAIAAWCTLLLTAEMYSHYVDAPMMLTPTVHTVPVLIALSSLLLPLKSVYIYTALQMSFCPYDTI